MEWDDCRSCIDCGTTGCDGGDKGFPPFCLTEHMEAGAVEEARGLYEQNDSNRRAAIAAAEVEAENYCKMCRVEETIEFAKKMGFQKIGIATCVGLIRESRTLAKILRSHGLEVYGAACKVGAQKKVSIGVDKKCEAVGENMCNPILQAKRLNAQGTQLNIVMGLCVGHDSLFYKYSEGLATTLVVKDRVLGHNPAAALYCADSYYEKKLYGQEK